MSAGSRLTRAVLGRPKDPRAPHAFHKLSLVALLAWVGLGADGLSSSAYGPEEAFRALGEHRGLAVFLAVATAATVFVISHGYTRIIERFPSGGGGYLVATRILGGRAGVVAGSALLVDYVLTITISMAAGADAIFSFLPQRWHGLELPVTVAGITVLTLMNLRGVKESVTAIAPVFVLFLVTHGILLAAAVLGHVSQLPAVASEIRTDTAGTLSALGVFGTLKLLMHAYSLGGGTYTGIEAVSNGVAMMREPRVETAKRTMRLMATSLAITAGGLLLCYLLWRARPVEGKTLNAVLFELVAGDWRIGGVTVGPTFVVLALVSEGALLFVAAQAGFLDGPRVMANMAVDSWLPHRFSALSERLTMRNGIVLMGASGLAALLYTGGAVSKLVVMYSINVFLTFSLSNIAMSVFWVRRRNEDRGWVRQMAPHVLASSLCVLILIVTVSEKFLDGGWITLLITAGLVALCFAIKRHYLMVAQSIRRVDLDLPRMEMEPRRVREPDPARPVAILFVGGYSGLGRHALMTLLRMFPGHFGSIVFASVAVVDSGAFKGADEVESIEKRTRRGLESYVGFAASLELGAATALRVGTEVAVEAERIAVELVERYPKALAVAGQVIFEEDTAWSRLLHNETAFQIQRRLQHRGIPMIVLPVKLMGPKERRTCE